MLQHVLLTWQSMWSPISMVSCPFKSGSNCGLNIIGFLPHCLTLMSLASNMFSGFARHMSAKLTFLDFPYRGFFSGYYVMMNNSWYEIPTSSPKWMENIFNIYKISNLEFIWASYYFLVLNIIRLVY